MEEFPGIPVQLLGINAVGYESGNDSITSGRVLPWMQDTEEIDVWGSWAVTWRDVVLVNGAGEKAGVYNLTEHSLATAENYEELKNWLVELAMVE